MNGWYCLTVFWKDGEIQSLWFRDWEFAKKVRVALKNNDEIEDVKFFGKEENDEKPDTGADSDSNT